MDVYDDSNAEERGVRMVMTAQEQIRIAALNAAIAYGASDNNAMSMNNLIMYADAFEDYIMTGDMPTAPAGVIW